MKNANLIFILFCLIGGSLYASDLDFSGFTRNYTGMFASEDAEFSILKNSFDLNIEYYTNNSTVVVNPYINTDWSEVGDLDLREIYIDLYFDAMDIRIGRQQVIWGKGDGVFITDVVSPKNLEEFILPDFKEVRIGVDALKLDYYLGSSTFEVIWVPLFTPNEMPELDSIWNTNGIEFSGSDDDIEATLENSEIFGRYSLMTSFMDLDLVVGSMWDDEPYFISTSELGHKRLFMVGGSFSSTLGDFIIRGEGAFFKDTTTESNYVNYVAGLDYSILGYKLSGQFIQKIILEDEFQNTMTFMINKSFLRETLMLELFSYVEFNDLNALVRPKITYDFDDGVSILLGANYFIGDDGTYGQFDDNDMIYTQLKVSF